jgi:ATP-dependent RNA helicase RhlE
MRHDSRDRAIRFRRSEAFPCGKFPETRLLQVRVEGGYAPRCARGRFGPAPPGAEGPSFVNKTTFSDLGVAEPIRRALESEDYLAPTPIQAQAIPWLLAGNDLIGIAQTGTGKTAAFVVPLLQRGLGKREPAAARAARALILAPTRELALQIGGAVETYGRHLGIRQAVILGGVAQRPQVAALARGVDVLIATPGRLLDLLGQGHVRLDRVSYFVLDEADRMLDMGFVRDVRKIAARLPRDRQSMLFSATMPDDVARLAGEILRRPGRIHVAPAVVTVERVDQRVFFVATPGKRALLSRLLADPGLARVLVFTRTKHGANRVAGHLVKSGVAADAIHGNKSQRARQSALERFRAGRARVLVATDVAARGIDVDGVTHVINYELPNVPESYVHRIGRTARAGAAGVALSFCDPSERDFLRGIERLTRRPLAVAGGQAAPRHVASGFPT